MFGLLDRDSGLAEFELFWTAFYLLYISLVVAMMAMTMERRSSRARTALGWALIVGIPLAAIASLPTVAGIESYDTGIAGVDRGPLIGPLILCTPLTAVAGSCLYRGGWRNRLAATLLDYVIVTVSACVLSLAIVKCIDRIWDVSIPEATLVLELLAGSAAIMASRRHLIGIIRSFSSGDGGFAGSYVAVLAPISACIAGSLILWLYDPRPDSAYTTGICLLSAIAFIVAIRAMFLGITEMSESARRDAELDAARELQLSAVPDDSSVDWMLGARIASTMVPAREVAGDFLDFFPIGERRIGIVVADVSGKGIPAALFMMRCRSVIRDRMASGDGIGAAAASANRSLCQDNPSCMFVTAFMADLDLDTGELDYVCAGHPAPFVRSPVGVRRLEGGRGPMMGFAETRYEQARTVLSDGDILLAYTDGASEAESQDGMFGDSGIAEALAGCTRPQDAVDAVLGSVRSFTDGSPQSDDITLLALGFRSTVHREFDAVPSGCGDAVAWVSGSAPDGLRMKAELVTEELFLNIASYAYDGEGTIGITASADGAAMDMTFIDSGRPFDPTGPVPSHDGPGGEGIKLVKAFCRAASYRRIDGRNVLTLRLEAGEDARRCTRDRIR